MGTATVERVRRRCVEEGVAAALGRKEQLNRRRKKLDGQGEAHPVSSTGQALIALACSPPEGRVSWTLQLLADGLVADGLVEGELVESISDETVRRTLKKPTETPVLQRGRLWLKECWCLPPQGSADFVCAPVSSTGQAMEDVLEVYHRSYEDKEVLVCLDETSKQLVGETRQSRPPRPGSAMAYDYEYQRNGVSNPVSSTGQALFMLFAPLEGWRRVEVTDRRTRADWARVVKRLVDQDYPDRERIVLVMDNLNTHHPDSLYEGVRAVRSAAHRRTTGDSLHAQARELAEYGGDRTGGAGPAMPGPPDPQPGNPGAGNRGMGTPAESAGLSGGLALHHRRRPHQAQIPIPINTTVIDH